MSNNVKVFELTDEQLKIVTGGTNSLSVPVCTSTNDNTAVNVSDVTQSNTILFRKMSNSPIGSISVTQSHATNQVNTVG